MGRPLLRKVGMLAKDEIRTRQAIPQSSGPLRLHELLRRRQLRQDHRLHEWGRTARSQVH
ncbi:hypothetical protein ANCCAN_26970, partial [Ancylostoma caninum]